MTTKVLMVCMGNICRSPTAEAVLRHKLAAAGLAHAVLVDSAGTHGWHAGSPPDSRAIEHAQRRGYELELLVSRPVQLSDFEYFDHILAMDQDNLDHLIALCPAQFRTKLGRLMQHARRSGSPIVPDPYQGGPQGFEHVLDLVEDACDGFVEFLRQKADLGSAGTS